MNINTNICYLLALSVACLSTAYAQEAPSVPQASPIVNQLAIDPTLAAQATVKAGQQAMMDALGASVPADPSRPFSYGKSNLSILFLPSQVARLKEAIGAFETENNSKPAIFAQPQEAVPAAQTVVVVEPPTYPVFFLSSIVYRAPNDWSIWMGGEKITSSKNETEVTVTEMRPDSVTFLWKPAYIDAIAQRNRAEAFAATDAVKNKLSTQQKISYDKASGAITFTLRQNQSFAVGYFKLFEGYIDSPTMQPITISPDAVSADGMATITDTAAAAQAVASPAPPMPTRRSRMPSAPAGAPAASVLPRN